MGGQFPDPTLPSVPCSKLGRGQPWGTGHREDGSFQGKPWLAVIFPGGHWRGARDPRGHQSSLESHALATSGCPRHSQRRSALVRVGHPTDIGGGGRDFVTGQASSCGMVVEHQGAWGGLLPTRSDHPQYWSVYD